ncbi:MAG: hypothetical protein ACXWPM_11760 [Bdellovibrionota bacterium]
MKLILLLSVLLSSPAWARPEYATKEKLNCIQCHVTPWGGGPRTVFGKGYGAHQQPMSSVSTSDYYYADARLIDYQTTNETITPNGLAAMEAAVTGSVPLTAENAGKPELRAVATYNIAPLSGSNLREAYLRWKLTGSTEPDDIPPSLVIGHFYLPFGLLTDEHRTYTRMQTNMTYNDFDTGIAFSANFSKDTHLDLALVNDFQALGGFTINGFTFGSLVNFRWNPSTLPFLLGGSFNFQEILSQPRPFAASVYGVLSVDRISSGKVSGSLSAEWVNGFHWNNPAVNTGGNSGNPPLLNFFIPSSDPGYAAQVAPSDSMSLYVLAKYNLTPQFTFVGKMDWLALDNTNLGDAFQRYGLGFEAYPYGNIIIALRIEKAVIGRPEIPPNSTLGAQDDILALFRLWI